MNHYQEVQKIAKKLGSEYSSLTEFEALQLATSIHQTEILSRGLCVVTSTNTVGIEAIAMILGFEGRIKKGKTVVDVLTDIRNR